MIIQPHPYGRMANRLILASTFIAQAEEYGDAFLHLAFADYFRFFEGTRHSPFLYYRSTQPAARSPKRLVSCVNIWNTYDKRDEAYDLAQPDFLLKQRESRFLVVIGWSFRTPVSTRKHRALIRRFFTPVKGHRDAVSRLMDTARKETDHLVGVHIRQTDYQRFANGKYFYPLSVYHRVMSGLAAQLTGRTRFLVCSDAAVDAADFPGLDLVRGTGHPVEDNYALSACDYVVGPPSTYTTWASFYGGTPKRFITHPDEQIDLASFDVLTSL